MASHFDGAAETDQSDLQAEQPQQLTAHQSSLEQLGSSHAAETEPSVRWQELFNGRYSDLTIVTYERDREMDRTRVHKAILHAFSPVFASILEAESEDYFNNEFHLRHDSMGLVNALLMHLYKYPRHAYLEGSLSGDWHVEVWEMGRKYGVDTLKSAAAESLANALFPGDYVEDYVKTVRHVADIPDSLDTTQLWNAIAQSLDENRDFVRQPEYMELVRTTPKFLENAVVPVLIKASRE